MRAGGSRHSDNARLQDCQAANDSFWLLLVPAKSSAKQAASKPAPAAVSAPAVNASAASESAGAIPNVLADRYASVAMRGIWSGEGRILLERDFWIAVMKAQRDLGVPIRAEAI